jgi:hypothetical protein
LDTRLKELTKQFEYFNEDMRLQRQEYSREFNSNTTLIAGLLTEIAKKIG